MTTQAFNFIGGQSPQQPAPGPLAQMALGYGGTGALPAIQDSEYLANALQNLQASGAQESKSGLALGSNLLADALLQWGRHRSNAALLAEIQQGQKAQLASASQGTGLNPDGSMAAPPPSTAAPPPAGAPPAAAPAVAGAGGSASLADTLAPPPPPASPQQQMLAALVSRGLSPVAASGLVGNYAQESGPNLNRDNPAEGAVGAANWRGPRAAAEQAYLAAHGGPSIDNQAGFTMQELGGPEARAMRLLQGATDPQSAAAAALAYERPAGWTPNGDPSRASGWNNRLATAQQVYGQFGGQGGPGAPQPPTGAGGPPMGGASSPVGQGAAGPYQVASNGPTPAPSPTQANGAPPVPPQGPPTGPQASPQEAQIIQQGLRFPQGSAPWSQAMQLMMQIRQRAATPMDPPKDMMWQGGRAVPVPGTAYQDVQGAPNAYTQRGPDGQIHVTGNPAYGAVPAGTVLGQGGPNGQGASVTPMGGTQPRPLTSLQDRAAAGIQPSDRNAYAVGPDGKVVKIADAPYGPTQIQSVHDNFWGSDETKKAQEAYSAFTGLTTALKSATGNSGPLDQAAIDSFLRGINPGMGARNSTVQMVMEHFGLPQELQGKISGLVGTGFVTPQSLQQMLQITHDYALAHQNAAATRAQSDAQMVKPYGYGAGDLAESLPTLGPVPTVQFGVQPGNAPAGPGSVSPAPAGNPGVPAGVGAQPPRYSPAEVQAARAELARRQAARQQAGGGR